MIAFYSVPARVQVPSICIGKHGILVLYCSEQCQALTELSRYGCSETHFFSFRMVSVICWAFWLSR